MNTINKTLKKIAILSIAIFSVTSCTKTEVKYESTRPTIVKTPDADLEINVVARDVLPSIEEFELLTIERSVTRPSDLTASLNFKVAKKSALISDYNTAHSASFIELPAAAYTLSEDLNNLVFNTGEFIKKIKIRIDKSQLNLSNQYALGFTISEVGTGANISSLKNALFSIGIKNQYDGKYILKGGFYHPTQSPGYDPFTVNVEMHTSGPNSIKMYVPDFGGYYHPGLFAGVLNAFGAQEPGYTINTTTNAVTVQNAFSGATTFYMMAPGYNSRYDPATKTIFARFGYNYSAGPVFNLV